MIEKKKTGEKASKTVKEAIVKKVSVAPAKKSVSIAKKSDENEVPIKEPTISKEHKAQPWIKVQTAEGWKRERRKEKMASKKE
ncbi:hypothetical protein [Parachlamydia acanthamoebae]|uniref:Uncharacterized protein n=2 Tax=Parachlamydia acanthamoebae TaxID=83552 RepID=F8KWX1_PARAV|nr:hypothetical protein [Parachlamydia acanthamoebae]KIA77675.1 hypothetical protein DB43_FZ00040 [Parachlamydia acanthamoebae]CCB86597.1 putative uncharacterized protein [Parachlamydia acanthamoebae UV-7]